MAMLTHPLREHALFRDVPEAELEALMPLLHRVRFQSGEMLFQRGQRPDRVFFIVRGELDVILKSQTGTHVIGRVRAGESVGEMAAIDGFMRSATVIAADEVEAFSVSADDFAHYLQTTPAVCFRLVRLLTGRLRQLIAEHAVDLLFLERWVKAVEGAPLADH